MFDHASDCPCRPCQLARQCDLDSDALLPSLDDLDSLADDLGAVEELEEPHIETD
ncbi:hypothetical protein [Desulfomonile tiedjei]|uniref:hypothetical protein n=1 Tax=Desulfomonile tiedjei TaxID=2358 RepID=UPI00031AFD06|nr:hypothetical protein [Desulfomonile tiedjei]